MKKIYLINILLLSLLVGFSQTAYAVKAYPGTIRITQPDGSVITIQKHGDEFLNWTTCGNRLVKQGPDGFYYFAEFSARGTVQATSTRVQPGIFPQSISTVKPPAVARENAQRLRREFAQIFSARSDISRVAPGLIPAVKSSTQSISIGQKKFLVLLVAFSDVAFTSAGAQNDFYNLLNQDGYSTNGGTGSAWNYFYENSSGTFDPQFDVIGPITLSQPAAYYGANDDEGNNIYERAREMVVEAIGLADRNLGVDFSQYDNDGDGYLDNIFVYFAGHNEAEGGGDNTIWPHSWSTYSQSVSVDGVTTASYACTSEFRGDSGTTMAGIGTFCHEFGHVIGLPDFYDTDYEINGSARGLGYFALMSSGNYNNDGRTPPYLTIIEREILAWKTDDVDEITEAGNYSLNPVYTNDAYISLTTNNGEFFLHEFRQLSGWDTYIPNSGLLIYHIDMSNNMVGGISAADRWSSWAGINSYASHQCCDLVEAVYPESAIGSHDQVPFPGSSNNSSFTDTSSPAAVDWAGNPIGITLTDIRNNGSSARFTVSINEYYVITGTVSDSNGNPVAGAEVTLAFEESSASGTVQKTAVTQSGSLFSSARSISREEVATVMTDGNGAYVFQTITREGTYHIVASKEGYATDYAQVDVSWFGTYTVNLKIFPLGEGVLKKHGPWNGTGVGYGSSGGSLFGAVGFSAHELAPYEGSTIDSISLLISGTSAAEVGIFITCGDETVLLEALTNPSFATMMQVDLTSYELIIPGGEDMKFGYYVIDSDYGWPLAIDDEPYAPMGFYIGQSLASMYENSAFGNIMISAVVTRPDNQLFTLGYHMMPYTGRTYRVGDSFIFRLYDDPDVSGVERPDTVTWLFDNQPQNTGDVITLTEGNHTVKAILTFSDHSQTIVYEIKCVAAEN
ncbi:MAG: M6 family metalloprotease domain-containing protein [Bacteroidales bacterium]|nr:M6 family metalloprotease domain-containing protein [Bacteroidales bacterium]MDD4500270.1 M6 family metalloprotease domain-containing protein [Bacteroidales bacterium]